MIAFIDDHRCVHGVGPICRVLGIAPSTYYGFKSVERDPELASDRARQDRLDMAAIKQAFDGSWGRYGARKVWHQLRREGRDIARCTVERLMKVMGLQGVVRGKKVITTYPDAAQPCPDDKVNRAFVAAMPNQLWVSDFTYVSSWQGMVYVAFVIDVFARRIVGWRVSTSMTTGFVLDALNQGHLMNNFTKCRKWMAITKESKNNVTMTRVDLRQRPPNREACQSQERQGCSSAALVARANVLDQDRPVTEVQSLRRPHVPPGPCRSQKPCSSAQ